MKILKTWAAAIALLTLTGAAHAALVNNPDGTVTDTKNNLIWLKNWNLGAGTAFDNGQDANDGLMTWDSANSWAASLTVGGVAAGTWRLATGAGFQPPGPSNEFAQLWLEVGATPAGLQAQFDNVQGDASYWTGSLVQPGNPWAFRTGDGFMKSDFLASDEIYAVAVRPAGATPALPEPPTVVLAMLALGATVVARRRRPG